MARLQGAQFDQRGVSRAIGRAERSGLRHGHGGWHPAQTCGIERSIFGKAPGLLPAEHLIAGLERAVRIGFDHFARKLQPGDEGQLWFELVFALGHQQIGEVERSGRDANQGLAGLAQRHRYIDQFCA